MPRKIRELIRDLESVGFQMRRGGGKGAHRKFYHKNYPGAVTVSGQTGADAKHYQEKQIEIAIQKIRI